MLQNFKVVKVFVVGDVMLDRNYFCTSTRMAPEAAHIPVQRVLREETLLGGAANVAKNLANVNVAVSLLAVLGADTAAETLAGGLPPGVTPVFFREADRQTTVKHRVFHAETGALLSRHDCETATGIADGTAEKLLAHVEQALHAGRVDALVLVDYNKGVLTAKVATGLIALANRWSVPTFVDPKINDYLKYQGCFCFKPNLAEGQSLTGATTVPAVLAALRTALNPTYTVLTSGADGLYLDSADRALHHVTHPTPLPVVDVTGAGDTALSTLVYMYLKGKDMVAACQAANRICGKSIQCVGNYNLSLADVCGGGVTPPAPRGGYTPPTPPIGGNLSPPAPPLGENISPNGGISTKIKSCSEVLALLGGAGGGSPSPEDVSPTSLSTPGEISTNWGGRGGLAPSRGCVTPTVFTNGCFDLVHSAHVQLLNYAKAKGEILIVGVNSDASVRRLKGPTRPINSQEERAELLASLPMVDYVILFDEDTPAELIKALRPTVLVKGGDYKAEDLVGREWVQSVRLYPFVPNRSTSLMVSRIGGVTPPLPPL